MNNKVIKIIFSIFLLQVVLYLSETAAAEKKGNSEFGLFLKEFRNSLKSGDKELIATFIHFPVIIGSGGDAFYNYDKVNKIDFVSNYFENFIFRYKKMLLGLTEKKIQKIIKNGANLTSFTYGMNEEGNSDGLDHAAVIPDGTAVYFFERCEGRNGACIAWFFSKFDGGYKLWGITYGR